MEGALEISTYNLRHIVCVWELIFPHDKYEEKNYRTAKKSFKRLCKIYKHTKNDDFDVIIYMVKNGIVIKRRII